MRRNRVPSTGLRPHLAITLFIRRGSQGSELLASTQSRCTQPLSQLLKIHSIKCDECTCDQFMRPAKQSMQDGLHENSTRFAVRAEPHIDSKPGESMGLCVSASAQELHRVSPNQDEPHASNRAAPLEGENRQAAIERVGTPAHSDSELPPKGGSRRSLPDLQ